jgi:hypothetical protein
MTINEAHQNLNRVLANARISMNGSPLTLVELSTLAQDEMLLYTKAKEFEESKKEKKDNPPQDKEEK